MSGNEKAGMADIEGIEGIQPNFTTLLVANRGEIAMRIMRTARAMGLRTLAVYSDADVDAPHVLFADDAVRLGPAPVGESYLLGGKIIEAALARGAQAIHPGYGFLSENAAFARDVEAAGLTFVGPSAQAIELMGDKATAKRRMISAGVACVPGYEGEDQSDGTFVEAARKIGYPVMVKASAGGGGRGMRLVDEPGELADALRLARSEAENAFGSGDLIVEKAIVRPRHVEVQVFADQHGNVIHLGERDCSVQRRHQKVIEESPCPVMTPQLRERMGSAAVEAAAAVDYCGAGTVEFLLDEQGEFYFLEMNTRLQVEHPVTEFVTGLDLVAMQLQVAQGAELGITQTEVVLDGHAMEVRFYAEDPEQDFLPSTGPVRLWHMPSGDGVRVDTGIATGGEVSPFYDSMVAKIVTHGATRDEARRKLIRALQDTALFGPKTNRDFLIDVLGHRVFSDGGATTAFIGETYGEVGFSPGPLDSELFATAAILQHRLARRDAWLKSVGVSEELLDWGSAGDLETSVQYARGEEDIIVSVRPVGSEAYAVSVGEDAFRIALDSLSAPAATLIVEDRRLDVLFHAENARTLHLCVGARAFMVTDIAAGGVAEEEAGGGGTVIAPMHGLLVDVLVSEGERVRKGDRLAVLEAMKMQHEILAEIDGTIMSVVGVSGTQVAADDLILVIDPVSDSNTESD